MALEVVRAAGGCVVRVGAGGLEVLVLHRVSPDEWRLPKGRIRDGEQPQATAVREVREETGVLAEVLCALRDTEHQFTDRADGQRRTKRTTYFLMWPLSPTTALPDPDFDRALWLAPCEAMARLTYDNERQVVQAALDLLYQPR
ncbi:MAG: NUDIX hydrolase [Armatimonadetes bacterium]|nr:NUDIX hydrolase [Armatimonadota bacterium]